MVQPVCDIHRPAEHRTIENDMVIAIAVMLRSYRGNIRGDGKKLRKCCCYTMVMGSTATDMLRPWVSKPAVTPQELMRLVWQTI